MGIERSRKRRPRAFTIEQLESRQLMAVGGLLGESDLSYVGAFRLPSGTFGASSFDYGGSALAYNPANNSLFIVGHDWHQAVAEISIPALNTGSLSNLSTASVLQPFVDVMARVPDDTLEGNVKVGGLMVVGNQLIGTAYEYYDADANAADSHFKLSSLNLSSSTVTGFFQVGNEGGGYVGGYMASVPSEWQDDFGASHMTGLAGVAIIARTSAGPGAFGFNPSQLGTSTAPATPLVNYPYTHGGSHPDDHPIADIDSQNPIYNTTSEVKGLVFPEGSESVLFFGSHGIGPWYYGTENEGYTDPARDGKGPHAYPYVYQVWAYRAADLRDVKNGVKQPWEVQPYDVWNYEPPYADNSAHAGGVAYDAASGRIYVAQPYGDGAKPVVYVYQVGAAAPDTTPPVISSIATSGVSSTGATVTWTTNEGSDTQVEYGTTTAYGNSTSLNTAMVTSHSAQLNSLAANTLYHYRVKSRDAAGNLAVSTDRTFTTAAVDTQAPVITSIATSGVSSTGATVTWTTNEVSDTQVEYGTTTAYGSSTTLNTAMVTSHSAQVSGLAANTLYHYRVKSRDAAGNLAVSADGTFTTSAQQVVYSYDNPPSLGPSNPATTVNVSNVSQLIAAINNLQSGQTIRLAAGTYNLSGLTDALYIPQGISDWTIRGATGDRDDVVIRGAGMSGSVAFGFWMMNSPRGTIADLTIDGVKENGIIANPGSSDLLIHNVRIVDSGSQFVKSNPNGSDGNDRGIVEYSVFEYRTTDTDDYTNGLSIHAGDGWIVRYNLFRNFLSPSGQALAGPAVLVWNGSSNTTVLGNTFIDVARGIALGLIDKAGGFDHQGGLIANNVFTRSPSLPQAVDAPIMVADSPNTRIFHNTILNRGSYPSAIEYRFGSTTGLQIRNNLSDSGIQARDGASGTVNGNTTNASLSWFVNAAAGDLHLVSTAPVINQAAVIAEVTTDIDGQSRGASPDVGADEYGATVNAIGTDGEDVRYLVASANGTMLELYNGDPSAPGANQLASWPINSGQRVSIELLGGNDQLHVEIPLEMNGPVGGVWVDAGTGSNTIVVRSGRIWLDATATGGTLSTEVVGGGHLETSGFKQHRLQISGANSRATIRPDSRVAVVEELSIGGGAILDITNNGLIVRGSAANKDQLHAEYESHIRSAQNGADAGYVTNWTGAGVTSSTARSNNVAIGFDLFGVGVIRNSDIDIITGLSGSAYEFFGAETVGLHDILIRFTYIGDGNFDGTVSFDDFIAMDSAFFGLLDPSIGWAVGDINFDHSINFDDFSRSDTAFFFQGARLESLVRSRLAFVSKVREQGPLATANTNAFALKVAQAGIENTQKPLARRHCELATGGADESMSEDLLIWTDTADVDNSSSLVVGCRLATRANRDRAILEIIRDEPSVW